jgi:opacity protein-like surface antigen
MRRAVWGLVLFVAFCSFSSKVRADADYFEAIARAEKAARTGDLASASVAISTALQRYPRDYTLTLKLAWIQFLAGDYTAAERTYRAAWALSDGNLDAQLGLGWALVQGERCDAGIQVLQRVLLESPNEAGALRGIHTCVERERVHGSIWANLGGSLYQDHPWMHISGTGLLGLSLQPVQGLSLGGAYRFVRLGASDARVQGFGQHEAYLQGGYSGVSLEVLAHAALIWGGAAVEAGSLHGGLSMRLRNMPEFLDEVLNEAFVSRYQDLWVVKLASSWRFLLGAFSLTPGLAVEQFARQALVSASLTAGVAFGATSLWINGKYGSEYRSAYLSQFAVFNGEDRSVWSAGGGIRVSVDQHWSLFGSYAVIRLRSADGLLSALHILSVGTAYVL